MTGSSGPFSSSIQDLHIKIANNIGGREVPSGTSGAESSSGPPPVKAGTASLPPAEVPVAAPSPTQQGPSIFLGLKQPSVILADPGLAGGSEPFAQPSPLQTPSAPSGNSQQSPHTLPGSSLASSPTSGMPLPPDRMPKNEGLTPASLPSSSMHMVRNGQMPVPQALANESATRFSSAQPMALQASVSPPTLPQAPAPSLAMPQAPSLPPTLPQAPAPSLAMPQAPSLPPTLPQAPAPSLAMPQAPILKPASPYMSLPEVPVRSAPLALDSPVAVQQAALKLAPMPPNMPVAATPQMASYAFLPPFIPEQPGKTIASLAYQLLDAAGLPPRPPLEEEALPQPVVRGDPQTTLKEDRGPKRAPQILVAQTPNQQTLTMKDKPQETGWKQKVPDPPIGQQNLPEAAPTNTKPTLSDLPAALKEAFSEIASSPPLRAASLTTALAQLAAQGQSPPLAMERAGIIASFILNAAMIPGFPPPKLMEVLRDGSTKTPLPFPLHTLSDSDALTYLVNFGVHQSLLKRIQKALKKPGVRRNVLLSLAVLVTSFKVVVDALKEELDALTASDLFQEGEVAQDPSQALRKRRYLYA